MIYMNWITTLGNGNPKFLTASIFWQSMQDEPSIVRLHSPTLALGNETIRHVPSFSEVDYESTHFTCVNKKKDDILTSKHSPGRLSLKWRRFLDSE